MGAASPFRGQKGTETSLNSLPSPQPAGSLRSIKLTRVLVHIYALVDPRDGAVRYVGKTTQVLLMRLRQHVRTARAHGTGRGCAVWIREVLDWGLRPTIELLESVPANGWREAEKQWGARFEALTNVASRLGYGATRTYVAQWTPELETRLGVEPDQHIATDMGISDSAVAYRRLVLGVPAAPSTWRWTPEFEARLGVDTDQSIASAMGISSDSVAYRRRVLGIPANPAHGGTHAKGYHHNRKSGPPPGHKLHCPA